MIWGHRRHEDKSVTTAVACGAREFISWDDENDPDAQGVLTAINERTQGRGFDTVFCPDTTSFPSEHAAHRAAHDALRGKTGRSSQEAAF
jgi:hypothetical protein